MDTLAPSAALSPTPGVRLLRGGVEAFPRMLEAIAQAKQRVYLEVYIFVRDGIGERFVTALRDASLRGVKVQVRLDGLGSWLHARSIRRELRQAGCEVRIYHPLRTMLTGKLRRDHRKALVVDDEAIFVGGINVADPYGKPVDEGGWLDLMVELRGPQWRWAGERIRGLPGPSARDRVRILLSGEHGARRLRRRYTRAFAAARTSVMLAQAYFLPDRQLTRALVHASRRGVRVELLLAGQSDIALVPAATRRVYRKLLEAGVAIFEWRASVLHAKLGLIDGQRLLLGSFNLDPLSMVNLEVLLEITQPPVVADAVDWFEGHLMRASPVRLQDCERRGWRGALDRLLGAMFLKVARLARRLISTRREEPTLPPRGPDHGSD